MLQSSINALGPVIISAQTSARRIFAFSTLPFAAIAAAMTTFTSQNFGANKVHRIAKGIRQGSLLAFGWAILVCIILFFASPFLNELVSGSNDPLLLDNAALYNRIGSLFYVPFADNVQSSALIDFAQRTGLCLRAAACEEGAETHFAADFRRGCIVVLGNEANGVSEELLCAAEHIYIPMRGHAESLNVSTAATAVLYEALRQRRNPQKRV